MRVIHPGGRRGRRARLRRLLAVVALLCALPPGSGHAGATPSVAEILQARPLAPTDVDLLEQFNYPAAPPLAPLHGADLSEQDAASRLDAYLQDEFPGRPDRQAAARSIFSDPTATAKIPSPTLRVALASLTGTIAEPAIDHILRAQVNGQPAVTDIRWVDASQLSSTRLVAEVRVVGDGQAYIQFNDAYRGENPFAFTFAMAHEPLHQDASVANSEEAINQALEELVYLRQLARHPELATSPGGLGRVANTKAVLRLNSGVGARMGLYRSNAARPLLPGSNTDDDAWSDFFTNRQPAPTPGNPLLAAYLANIHTGSGPPCSGAQFSRALLDCIDREGNGGVTPAELVAAARALKLDTKVERRRSISLRLQGRRLAGTISSATGACERRQVVTLARIRNGVATRIGTVRTTTSGSYASTLASRPIGTYRASVARRSIPGYGVCLPASGVASP